MQMDFHPKIASARQEMWGYVLRANGLSRGKGSTDGMQISGWQITVVNI